MVAMVSAVAWADTLTGRVVGVVDGDTLDIVDDAKAQHRVRVHGIDAPERGQPFSQKARGKLSELTFGKTVRVESDGDDRYGRAIGRVFVGDADVELAMLDAGMAWHYVKYDSTPAYAAAEKAARAARRGLWSDPHAVPPWEWRKLSREHRDKVRAAAAGVEE